MKVILLVILALIVAYGFHFALDLVRKYFMMREIFSLLEPSPALGSPWPSIPGPESGSHVCVVGAGPAGVHIALELIKKNRSVILLEKTNRIGGKSLDIDYHGVANPQGTCFLEPNHFDNIVPLAEEFDVGQVQMIPSSPVWATNSASDEHSKLSTMDFIMSTMIKFTNTTDHDTNLKFLFKKSIQYIKIHKELFGTYEGDLMERPNSAVMKRIGGTFLEFLRREDLHMLEPVFILAHTMQGYGQPDKVAALYGLIWNNPKFFVAITLNALEQDFKPYSIFIMKDGFEKIWKTVVEKTKMEIMYNVDIKKVHRSQDNVKLEMSNSNTSSQMICDWLVWTPPMTELIKVLENPTHEEKLHFEKQKHAIFTASLVNMEGANRNGPYQAYMKNLAGEEIHTVTADFDLVGVKTPDIRTNEGLKRYNEEKGFQTRAVVQMGIEEIQIEDLNKLLIDHYSTGFNASNIEILHTYSHPYFARWSPEDIEDGPHWNVFSMQGQHRTWYAGASVSFESVRSVMEYNKLLLKQMVVEKHQDSTNSDNNIDVKIKTEF